MTTNGERTKSERNAGGKRIDAYTYAADAVVLITDPKDPLYDKRVTNPITRERVVNVATFGILQSLIFRKRGTEIIVNVGKQRTKTVLVINALLGTPYKGDVKVVHEAIAEFSKDEELVKLVMARTKGVPLRLPGLIRNSGDVASARLIVTSENSQRVNDSLQEAILRVQQNYEQHHIPVEDLAIAEGRSVASIKRWLNLDASKPRAKKTRGKAVRPSIKTITGFIEKHGSSATKREKVIFDWWLGKADMSDLVELFTK